MSDFKRYAIQKQIDDSIAGATADLQSFQDGDLIIAVMDRGWVFVGFVTKISEEEIRLDCAHNVHKWGTTKGLGEIALAGPTTETVLYKAGVVYGKPILLMAADIDNW